MQKKMLFKEKLIIKAGFAIATIQKMMYNNSYIN